jgi:MinD superfamily P-loop ATPase
LDGTVILAIASGKGGTGKTTLAVNLARVCAPGVLVLDCDVEAPNAHLFLGGLIRESRAVGISIPVIDGDRCTGCGECSRFCRFNAIVSIPGGAVLFPELCHGCGGCARVCPEDAVAEATRQVGVVETYEAAGITLVRGLLDIGSTLSPVVVREVRTAVEAEIPTILDAPPGTSCPVVAAVRHSDFVLLVGEPTPFGLHDLQQAVEMVEELGLPFGVAINRVGTGDQRMHRFCEDRGIPLLMEIPDDRRIAEVYSRGELIVDALPEYRNRFVHLADALFGTPAGGPAAGTGTACLGARRKRDAANPLPDATEPKA